MSNMLVGILAGFFGVLPIGLAVLAHVAKRNADQEVVPLWQASIFVVGWIIAAMGIAAMGIEGQAHFHKEFSETYFWLAGIAALGSGVAIIAALLDIDF